ncbi:MAG TPA: hypothetical protein VKE98_18110 [Gemmataceae bacterium]|nr:hypothetical protein [Gemmataceae bacterium]
MAYQVICPFCRQRLEIAEGIREVELTCPRCLKKVANPGVGIQSRPPARGAAAATGASSLEQCPRCRKGVQAGWQYCPFCNAELAVPSAPTGIRAGYADRQRLEDRMEMPLDVEVRRDSSAVGAGLIAVGVLGFIGLFAIVSIRGNFDWDPQVVLILGIGLVVMVLIGVARVAHKSRTRTAAASTAVAGGCMTAVMGAVLVFLVGMLVLAQALQSCSKGCNEGLQFRKNR